MSLLDSPRAEAHERHLRLLAKDAFRPSRRGSKLTAANQRDVTNATQNKGILSSKFVQAGACETAPLVVALSPAVAVAAGSPQRMVARDRNKAQTTAGTAHQNAVHESFPHADHSAPNRVNIPPSPSALGYVCLVTPSGGMLQIPRAGGKPGPCCVRECSPTDRATSQMQQAVRLGHPHMSGCSRHQAPHGCTLWTQPMQSASDGLC